MTNDLLAVVENTRQTVNGKTHRGNRAKIGQFLTPAPTAHFMASLFERPLEDLKILDAGAGVGTLFAACVQVLCDRDPKPKSIDVLAVENDRGVLPYLYKTMESSRDLCSEVGIDFVGEVREEDFVSFALEQVDARLFVSPKKVRFTHAILNPPYKKINGRSRTRKLLDASGFGTSNLYTAFVWLSVKMLEPGGELVAITPRSFCNGPYFSRFRKSLLGLTSLQRIHVFESRKKLFSEDGVLQENVIYHTVRSSSKPRTVTISSTPGLDFGHIKTGSVAYEKVIIPGDSDNFIHLPQGPKDRQVMKRMKRFACTLESLDLEVSTGRVVDFRARHFLKRDMADSTVPLIYPGHFKDGFVAWPNPKGKKPNAIVACDKTVDLLLPSGYYVLTKRFTSKEELRRVVASVFDPQRFDTEFVGFENHLNYFHIKGEGLSANMAKGLAVFLNTTLFDDYFRLFSGHTQVNATDLRKMRYPSREELLRLGAHVKKNMPRQEVVDSILAREIGADE